jgi:hypothetical protein
MLLVRMNRSLTLPALIVLTLVGSLCEDAHVAAALREPDTVEVFYERDDEFATGLQGFADLSDGHAARLADEVGHSLAEFEFAIGVEIGRCVDADEFAEGDSQGCKAFDAFAIQAGGGWRFGRAGRLESSVADFANHSRQHLFVRRGKRRREGRRAYKPTEKLDLSLVDEVVEERTGE